MSDYVIDPGYELIKLQAVTLANDSTKVVVDKGTPFFIINTGNATMYIGPNAAQCTTPGLPIYQGGQQGPYSSAKGEMYMRGTALQTAVISYVQGV